MAEVYKRVHGLKFEKFIALLPGVQNTLAEHRDVIAARAEAILNTAKHRTGDSQITTEDADVDKHVVLDDSRGQDAAMQIEWELAPLRRAAGIPVSKRELRKKRRK